MKIEKILNDIVSSSVYKKEVGTSFQLGLPRFAYRNNELYIKFYPHLERYSSGKVAYYSPQYELELVYPFRHIVLFRNLTYTMADGDKLNKSPVQVMHIRDLADNADSIRYLFHLADDIICSREQNNSDLESLVGDYDRQYILTAESMGLQTIYGGTYDSHSGI